MTHQTVDPAYHLVCQLSDLQPGVPHRVRAGDTPLFVCLVGGALYALSAICPHKDRPFLVSALIGSRILCPHHGYQFDITTGRCSKRGCDPLQTYDVMEQEGDIYIKL